jgi:hypothetical protein
VWAAQRFLGRLRTAIFLAAAVLLLAGQGAHSLQEFAVRLAMHTARVGLITFVVVFLYRDNLLAYVLTFLAGRGLGTAVDWIRQPSPGLRVPGIVFAVLVLLTIALVVRLATRRARAT